VGRAGGALGARAARAGVHHADLNLGNVLLRFGSGAPTRDAAAHATLEGEPQASAGLSTVPGHGAVVRLVGGG